MTETADANLAVVRRLIEAVNSDGLDGALRVNDEIAHPEIEWAPALQGEVEGRTFRGRDEMRDFWRDTFESFDGFHYEDVELRGFGDEVVLFLARIVADGRQSGAPVEAEPGIVLEFEDGLIRRSASYLSRPEAIAAAEALIA